MQRLDSLGKDDDAIDRISGIPVELRALEVLHQPIKFAEGCPVNRPQRICELLQSQYFQLLVFRDLRLRVQNLYSSLSGIKSCERAGEHRLLHPNPL